MGRQDGVFGGIWGNGTPHWETAAWIAGGAALGVGVLLLLHQRKASPT